MTMRYYIIQAYSGFEDQVRSSLAERIKNAEMQKLFGEILVPSEEVQTTKNGKQRTNKRRFYPGYIFVEMEMTEQAWHLVKETPKVTGFIGNQNPTPVPDREVKSIRDQMEKGTSPAAVRANFDVGDQVKVVSGAFANFTGTVEEVKTDRQRVKVMVPIFGRPTPVELSYAEVEKITT